MRAISGKRMPRQGLRSIMSVSTAQLNIALSTPKSVRMVLPPASFAHPFYDLLDICGLDAIDRQFA